MGDSSEEAWSRLALYRSRDVLQRRYKARHGRQLNAGTAAEIIAHFEQGQQYFRSAETAGVLAGPLQQYYGVLAFARALVLYLKPRSREAALKKSHGLHADLPSNAGLEWTRLVVQEGTFLEFLEATRNAVRVVIPRIELSSGFMGTPPTYDTITRSLARLPLDASFTLMDLLARIPGLRTWSAQAKPDTSLSS